MSLLDFPPGTAGSHKLEHVFFGDRNISDPTEFGDFLVFVDLPVFKHVDQQVRIRLIKGDLVHKTEEMRFFPVIRVKKFNVSRIPIFGSLVELGEKRYMITGLCCQNKPQVVPLQITYMGTIAAQTVFDNDHF